MVQLLRGDTIIRISNDEIAKLKLNCPKQKQSVAAQFLYRIQPVHPEMLTIGPTESESKMVEEHYEYLKRLTRDGTVVLAGRTKNIDSSSFGIVIFRAETEENARKIMNEDPAIKARVFPAELFPYKMALFNPRNSSEMLGSA